MDIECLWPNAQKGFVARNLFYAQYHQLYATTKQSTCTQSAKQKTILVISVIKVFADTDKLLKKLSELYFGRIWNYSEMHNMEALIGPFVIIHYIFWGNPRWRPLDIGGSANNFQNVGQIGRFLAMLTLEFVKNGFFIISWPVQAC